MSKMKTYTICILVIMLSIFVTAAITKKIIWGKAYEKYNSRISSIYADIVYSFASKKESTLQVVSSKIIKDEIIYLQNHQIDPNLYSYLCPYLKTEFKNAILKDNNATKDISNKGKLEFLKGYHKLTVFCNNKGDSRHLKKTQH